MIKNVTFKIKRFGAKTGNKRSRDLLAGVYSGNMLPISASDAVLFDTTYGESWQLKIDVSMDLQTGDVIVDQATSIEYSVQSIMIYNIGFSVKHKHGILVKSPQDNGSD